jgi:homoserine kinase type II
MAFPLQPCLCDVWHDHLLFEEDRLTGIVDYGSVKLDHVAVDLARLLGTLIGDDEEMRTVGMMAYRKLGPMTSGEEELAWALDETGTVVGAANWLQWLYRDGKVFEDPVRVAKRLGEIVQRLEKW